MRNTCSIAAAVFMLATLPAQAHVTLENQQAAANTTYKAVFRVPHGCEGAATTAVRIRIPDGITQVKPQPKAGWQLSTVNGKLATPISDGHGGQITEGVTEVTWSGGNLPDAYYDEFVMRMRLPATPDVAIHFPIVQECEKGVTRWIEIPEAGKAEPPHPAPVLKLTKPQGGH